MVQPAYAINDTFRATLFPENADAPNAVDQPRRDLRGGPIRLNERVNWKNFVDTGVPTSPAATRFASTIDPLLSPPLLNLPTSLIPELPPRLRSLAVRNLERGFALRLPSGQSVADEVCSRIPDLEPLHDAELWHGPQLAAFRGCPAPLWYYVLREADVRAHGESLGPIGGRIVAEVIRGLLELDASSFVSRKPDWRPQVIGRSNADDFTFADFFRIGGNDVS
jgi:hypothetical protein